MKRTRIFGMILTLAAGLSAMLLMNACQPDAVGSYQSPLTPTETILSRATTRSLAYEGVRRNPVILIHGLLGARLEDPATGVTVRVMRSSGRKVVLITPRYKGDGTRCRCLQLAVSRYVGGRAVRSRSRFLVPPPADAAKMKRTMYGAEVRNNPGFRTVLSNGAGASAQVRVGWGVVESQYDALFAANPCPDAPSDRLLLWTRACCWLQREGYVRELDAKCVTGFTADPAGRFARWNFRVPCGMGLETSFVFTLSLAAGANAARLTAERTESGGDDPPGSVRLVFRPDVEWRSFHSTTKAYIDGVDGRFRNSCEAVSEKGAQGFDFHPYGGRMSMRVSGGEYHHEPQWTYGVGHPEEASRGLDGSGDLFSPGWISADLAPGGSIDIVCSLDGAEADFPAPAFYTTEASFADSLSESIGLYIARRGDFKTVIAGYPWFLDWGRDTFIARRGMIAAGMYSECLAILKAFAAFEEKGTLPNIIFGATAGNRDTSDAPLWFVRCVAELGGKAASLKPVCDSIVDGYLAGTPNGIKVDPESALVWSPSHFTWMDTNMPACTPRIGYPIEIQALWISALRFLGRDALAEKALASVKRLFALPGGGYADCLDAPDGRPAASALQDGAVRPNQLLLVSLGVLRDESIVRATEALTAPGGIRSLASGHYLYRGVYAGDEDSSRKPAYHNGTVWTWQFPMFVEAMCDLGLCTAETALSLLASSVENLNTGCLCHMSEIADGDAPHAQKGCCAQAWGDSELLRVWLKLSNRPGAHPRH